MKTISQVSAWSITLCVALSSTGCGLLLGSDPPLSKFDRKGFFCSGDDAEGYSVFYKACYERVSSALTDVKPKFKKKIESNLMTCRAFGPRTVIDIGGSFNPEQMRAECSATVTSEGYPDSVLAKLKVDVDALAASPDRRTGVKDMGTVIYFDREGQVVHTSSLNCIMRDGEGVDASRDDRCPSSLD